MRHILLYLLLLSGFLAFSQSKKIEKPKYVILANNAIISQEKLMELANQGLVKKMDKGVSEKERDILAKKFGDAIGDKEFIIKITLGSKTEKTAKTNTTKTSVKKKEDIKLQLKTLASDFTLEMIDGQKIKLSELKGKVVLINYWATWCAPCLMELAEFPEKILKPFADKQVVVLPISIGETKEKVLQKMAKLKKYGITFAVGIDPEKKIWNTYASGAIPKNFLLDKNGIIQYISTGNAPGNVDTLAREIQKLIAQ